MAYYVIGDIHGCYDDFLRMLNLINFNKRYDKLFLIGDYIDRGPKSIEMVQWLMDNVSRKVIPIRGNHEQEFIGYVDALHKEGADSNLFSAYEQCKLKIDFFDEYGTLNNLIYRQDYSIYDLDRWKDLFNKMRLWYRFGYVGTRYYLAHAGYPDCSIDEDINPKELMLYSRKASLCHFTTVVVGHTPTLR